MKKQDEDVFEPAIPVVPKGWDVLPFEQAVDVISDKSKRVKQSTYLPSGKLPVIDQGQDFIGGYTDDEDMAFEGELPVILFGDHTRSIKYVDRSFAVGAEGVKILKPSGGFDPKFFYYLLRSLQIPSRGYSRHFQFLRKFHFESDYGVDIGLFIDAALAGGKVIEVDIGHIEHDSQSLESLGDMASQVVRTLFDRATRYRRFNISQIREVEEVERHMQVELSVVLQKVG